MKNLFIFTASFGNGHLTASRGLQERFEQRGDKVRVFDIAEITWGGKVMKYLFTILPEWVLQKIFDSTNTPVPSWVQKLFQKVFFSSGIRKVFSTAKNIPDEVWATFPLVTGEIQKNFLGNINIQITDYFTPHLSWVWGNPSQVFCLDQSSRSFFLENSKDIKSTQIIIEKFPLPQKIENIKNISEKEKNGIKKSLQDTYFFSKNFTEKKILLFFFHHVLLGNEEEVLEKFLKSEHFSSYNFCILAGKQKEIFLKYSSEKTQVIDWVSEIENFYAIADGVIGKCGGAFISEVMELQIPIFISGVFSGQEKGNKKYLEKYYSENFLEV